MTFFARGFFMCADVRHPLIVSCVGETSGRDAGGGCKLPRVRVRDGIRIVRPPRCAPMMAHYFLCVVSAFPSRHVPQYCTRL
jgi:hypothetical protein